jgi:hypothetical protein
MEPRRKNDLAPENVQAAREMAVAIVDSLTRRDWRRAEILATRFQSVGARTQGELIDVFMFMTVEAVEMAAEASQRDVLELIKEVEERADRFRTTGHRAVGPSR